MDNQGRGIPRFINDYMEGAHPTVLQKLIDTNLEQTPGYGSDWHSERARDLIRRACGLPDADIFFLAGGTQTNATVIASMLSSWQGVIAPATGHISTHEAGAIEFGGHKVIELPSELGKIRAAQVDEVMTVFENDANNEHMVEPALVYLSQPTEYGTLYTLRELEAISSTCKAHGIGLYIDGARLAYALACRENDVALHDLGRLCDAFYIGGTKCGTLFGEAVVIPRHGTIPHFLTQVKQHGALLAKGRIAGVQFEALFEDGLYFHIGQPAIDAAVRLRNALAGKGYELCYTSPTNQIFIALDADGLAAFDGKAEYGFWENLPDGRTVIRLTTSWATTDGDVENLISTL